MRQRIPWIALLLLVMQLTACGYRSVVARDGTFSVAAVTTHVPAPALAACLTRELRLTLAARTDSMAGSDAEYRLMAELIAATARPGTLARDDDGPRPVDQETELVLRARLVHHNLGVVWGPTRYRLPGRAGEGPGALASRAAAQEGLQRSCSDAAQRLVDDVLLHLTH